MECTAESSCENGGSQAQPTGEEDWEDGVYSGTSARSFLWNHTNIAADAREVSASDKNMFVSDTLKHTRTDTVYLPLSISHLLTLKTRGNLSNRHRQCPDFLLMKFVLCFS